MNFDDNVEVHGLSKSMHLLFRVKVYSEETLALFD